MKPPKFDYHAPRTLDEAIGLLARHDGAARVLAGGQSLVPMLNFRLAQPAALIDLRLIAELAGITLDGGTVRIGAMTRQRHAERSGLVAAALPLMTEALRWVGHAPTRSRGTIGGSIAHADPSAELPLVLRALDGEVVAAGPAGTRVIPAGALFESMFTTTLRADEILTEVRMPTMPAGTACAIEEFARRPGDFAIVAVAVVLEPTSPSSYLTRIAIGGATDCVYRAGDAERLVDTEGLSPDVLDTAARLASEAHEPMTDPRVSADYRRHLIRALTGRALQRAAATVGPWTRR
jgi:carbon-monoxide dehydrogenase medium subunit